MRKPKALKSMTSDEVLSTLVAWLKMDIADIYDDDGMLLPVSEWPPEWRQACSGIETVEMKSRTEVAAFLRKVKLPDKLDILKTIGNHVAVQAFKTVQQSEVQLSGIDALHAKRVGSG